MASSVEKGVFVSNASFNAAEKAADRIMALFCLPVLFAMMLERTKDNSKGAKR